MHRGLGAHPVTQLHGKFLDVGALEQLLDRLGAHLRPKLGAVVRSSRAILLLGQQLVLLELALPGVDDHVGLEVQDPLQVAERDVEQVTDPTRQALKEPHMADRSGQRNVPEPLAADLRLGDLNPTLVTNHPPVLHALVFAAQAFPVGDWAEDLRAKQPVPLRFKRPVVDGLRFGDLAM